MLSPQSVPASDSGSGLAFLLRRDPVVITGAGAVSAAGEGVEALWTAVVNRQSPAGWCRLPGPGGGMVDRVGFPVPELDWAGHPWRGMARRLDAGGRMALRAAYAAADQAGLLGNDSRPQPTPERLGVICGSSRGPIGKWEEAYDLMHTGQRMKPTLAATTTLAAASGALAQVLEANGPSWLVSAACASGAFAIAAAAERIALGYADVMLAGGTDQSLNAVVCSGLAAAGVMARSSGEPADWCRPFCLDRTGLVPGDGAGLLVLESLSSARRRGVTPLAVLSGWGLGMDPEGLAGMDAGGAGLRRTMTDALALAGLSPADIGYINAHGTGTWKNDAAEASAMAAVFGPEMPPCSSSKSITGHCLGATPALEAILCLQALRRGILPPAFPTAHTTPAAAAVERKEKGPDPAGAVRFSPGGPCPGLRHALSSSAGFWGFQSSLIFSRWEEA
ncbi:MAG: 3-oxoacyl-(acyl-carrier-protein) synthase 2 [Verrucomicrobiales bacterium]|nr:3-oxoacyl-(acyl-carrier-protein) synthase 2 [Verrucomicrobiales bacterium]